MVQIPTISDTSLGSNVWGAGLTGVLVYMNGPWVASALANNVWSLGGTSAFMKAAVSGDYEHLIETCQAWVSCK
jgi:hypothetical protein